MSMEKCTRRIEPTAWWGPRRPGLVTGACRWAARVQVVGGAGGGGRRCYLRCTSWRRGLCCSAPRGRTHVPRLPASQGLKRSLMVKLSVLWVNVRMCLRHLRGTGTTRRKVRTCRRRGALVSGAWQAAGSVNWHAGACGLGVRATLHLLLVPLLDAARRVLTIGMGRNTLVMIRQPVREEPIFAAARWRAAPAAGMVSPLDGARRDRDVR